MEHWQQTIIEREQQTEQPTRVRAAGSMVVHLAAGYLNGPRPSCGAGDVSVGTRRRSRYVAMPHGTEITCKKCRAKYAAAMAAAAVEAPAKAPIELIHVFTSTGGMTIASVSRKDQPSRTYRRLSMASAKRLARAANRIDSNVAILPDGMSVAIFP